MGFLGYGLEGIAAIVGIVCFAMVVIKMFQSNQTAIGVVCIVLFLCFGLGMLFAFVFGWIKAKEWNITNLMIVWTVAWVIGILGGVMVPNPFAGQ
jgi:hypothetical protein